MKQQLSDQHTGCQQVDYLNDQVKLKVSGTKSYQQNYEMMDLDGN